MPCLALATLFTYMVSLAMINHIPLILGTDDPLSFSCDTSHTFPSEGTYSTNLNNLIVDLSKNVSKTGFASSIKGSGKYAAHGLALCRGDVSFQTCHECVANAAQKIQALCIHNKTAVIWYDSCLLKYSGKKFFGKIDLQNRFALLNANTLSDSIKFVETTDRFLSDLSRKAVSNASRLYAAGEWKLCDYLTVFGLAQCTRDLSAKRCMQCLDYARCGLVAYVAPGKQGGSVAYASCSLRYEIYPITNTQR